MKTTLSDLLKQITPLPYHVQPIGSERYIEAAGPTFVADMQRNACLDAAEVERCEKTLAYLVHAANTLPEVVTALEDCRESLLRLKDQDGAYRATCLKQCNDILTHANEIEL